MKLFLSLLLAFSFSMADGQLVFEKAINISSTTFAGGAIETADQHIIYCGTWSDAAIGHLIIGKLDFEGNETWQKYYDSNIGNSWGIVELPDNNFVIAYDKNNYLVLLKVNADGDSLTSVNVNPSGGTDAFLNGSSLDVTGSGILFFSAYEHGINPFGDPYAGAFYARFSPSLTLIEYGVPEKWICFSTATSYPSQVKCDHSDRYGYAVNLNGSSCAAQANLGVMNSNGDSIWIKNLWLRNIASIDIDDYGDCFVSSNYYDDTSYVSRFDSSGNLLWENKLDYDGHAIVAAAPGDGVVLGNSAISLKRYDENGNYLWSFQVGNGYSATEMKSLERCHDNSYLGCSTVQDSSTLDYSMYIFRTETDEILGVQETNNLNHKKNLLRVFPIPAHDYCRIQTDPCHTTSHYDLHIKDLFGRTMYMSPEVNCETTIDLIPFARGIYVAQLQNGEVEISSMLFIVQ